MFPIVLVIVGVVFLLKNLNFISQEAWDIVWPLLFIAAGAAMLAKKNKNCSCWMHGCDEDKK